MTKPMVRIITGENIVDREMSDTEHADYKTEQANKLAEVEAETKTAAAKAKQKQAVLDRLGITADEAALLLG